MSLLFVSFVSAAAEIQDIRVWNAPERTRIVFDLSEAIEYELFALRKPARIVIDIVDSNFTGQLPVNKDLGHRVARLRTGRHGDRTRFVLDITSSIRTEHFSLLPIGNKGHRLVVDLHPTSTKTQRPKQPSVDNEFVVIIDAGHGGEDPGAIGARKTYEKHLVLKIAKKLTKELSSVPGIRAELTRKGDYYIPLRKRTQIARERSANMFVSIHADAFTRPTASGISVFALSQSGATSERARLLAKKENASDIVAGERKDLLKMEPDVLNTYRHLAFVGANDRLSVELGDRVRARLSKVGKLHGNSVEKAGFAVLKAPGIPSILVEVGFISNPEEERKLNTKAYQTKIVNGIKTGIVQYVKEIAWKEQGWRFANSQ